jgi:hypothetical protein
VKIAGDGGPRKIVREIAVLASANANRRQVAVGIDPRGERSPGTIDGVFV